VHFGIDVLAHQVQQPAGPQAVGTGIGHHAAGAAVQDGLGEVAHLQVVQLQLFPQLPAAHQLQERKQPLLLPLVVRMERFVDPPAGPFHPRPALVVQGQGQVRHPGHGVLVELMPLRQTILAEGRRQGTWVRREHRQSIARLAWLGLRRSYSFGVRVFR